MIKFLFALFFGLFCIAGGAYFVPPKHLGSDNEIVINFRGQRRIAYQEKRLGEEPTFQASEIKIQLRLAGQNLEGTLTPLRVSSPTPFGAMSIEIDEDQSYEPKRLMIVKTTLEEAKQIQAVSHLHEPFKIQSLSVNGINVGQYLFFQNPFGQAISRGMGPLVQKRQGQIQLSALSAQFPVFRNILQIHSTALPENFENWWVFNGANKTWQPFAWWPQGWPL